MTKKVSTPTMFIGLMLRLFVIMPMWLYITYAILVALGDKASPFLWAVYIGYVPMSFVVFCITGVSEIFSHFDE